MMTMMSGYPQLILVIIASPDIIRADPSAGRSASDGASGNFTGLMTDDGH